MCTISNSDVLSTHRYLFKLRLEQRLKSLLDLARLLIYWWPDHSLFVDTAVITTLYGSDRRESYFSTFISVAVETKYSSMVLSEIVTAAMRSILMQVCESLSAAIASNIYQYH